ncbi:MAG: hypothetical protein LBF16_02040 [Pseudomonadales bacterium]|jgi:hypothetical protein|nr:hypothetical protein [Pseudomonadales bacterium]
MKTIKGFLIYNSRNEVLPDPDNKFEHYEEWRKSHLSEFVFGPIVKYTWEVDWVAYERLNPKNDYLKLFPDATGFLLFEKAKRPDNLVLLDVYGNQTMRLAVPWRMTGSENPASGLYPTRFIGLTTPLENPDTGEEGKLGVFAWIEYAGDWYFELEPHKGEFLWCRRLLR